MYGMTQKEMIRDHLMHGLSITPAKAFAEYGTMRLAAYIHELRQEGLDIETVQRKAMNGRPYGEYRLMSEGEKSEPEKTQQDFPLEPGMRVENEEDGKGTVRAVYGGRAQVVFDRGFDFNFHAHNGTFQGLEDDEFLKLKIINE